MRRLALVLAVLYLVLLAWSHAARHLRRDAAPGGPSVTFARDPADRSPRTRTLTVAWRELGRQQPGRLPAVVLHGSPGDGSDVLAFAEVLSRDRLVLVPDLPGSGRSTRHLSSYSYPAQAERVRRWLEAVGLSRAHVIGYSMGGGVAITMAGGRGTPVASLTLLSSIGVQSMELFGDHGVNRVVHGAQLALLWLASEGIPHFGALDASPAGVPYARTFFDSDQRPLAAALAALEMPTLIVHGRDDPLIPVAAAREHARLVPHAELRELDADHLLVMQDPVEAAGIVGGFLGRVEDGRQPTRREATAARIDASRRPFEPREIPPAGPVARLVLVLVLALATLLSEDAACIAAGVLVAHGQIGFAAGVLGCVAGIVSVDAAIYVLGRGSAGLLARRWPLASLGAHQGAARAMEWLRLRGAWALAGSRFVPGTRVVTCFAAGAVRVPPAVALGTIAVAALAWTPMLVGLSAVATRWSLAFVPQHGALLVGGLVLLPWLGARGLRGTAGHVMRRRLAGWRLRITRWEFWPAWMVYVPVVLMVLPRALRARSLTAFTAANPGMPGGGFVGESKIDILRALARGGAPVAPFVDLSATSSAWTRVSRARAFLADRGLPVVLKPDQGQRGAGVRILRTESEVDAAVTHLGVDAVLQAYVEGVEFGLFYARRPGDETGRLISLTEKRLPVVTGDGVRTIARLIDDDPRAVALACLYKSMNASRVDEIPGPGVRVTLAELGSHCRGAIFLDAAGSWTQALVDAVERSARAMPGFCFGRFDVRAEDARALMDGRFTILELNGVTSEPTHVYDPACSFAEGVRTLAATWVLAFDIGAGNAAAGARVWSVGALVRLAIGHARFRRARDRRGASPLDGPRTAHATDASGASAPVPETHARRAHLT